MTRLDGSVDRWRDGGLPVPRQQFVEAFVGVVVDAGEDVGEPGFWVDGVEFGGFDE